MRKNKIIEAIEKSKVGIKQYVEIMSLFHEVDVSTDKSFQRKFNSFYRIRQRSAEWYETYYNYMETHKSKSLDFKDALRYFNMHLSRYEPSFSSKLVATINPNMPVWDQFVLKNIGLKPPAYTSVDKFELAIKTYDQINEWYELFMASEEAFSIIETFKLIVSEHEKITDLKKVDFVLWQLRD